MCGVKHNQRCIAKELYKYVHLRIKGIIIFVVLIIIQLKQIPITTELYHKGRFKYIVFKWS